MPEQLLIALGGNALIRAGQRGTIEEQTATLRQLLAGIVELIRLGHQLVITHGNGPQAVLDVVDDCAHAGIHAVIVITAGFDETDTEGRELERRLKDKIAVHGMRLVGPNCVGLINTDPAVRLTTTLSPVHPARGRVAIFSQSGAIGVALLAAAGRFVLPPAPVFGRRCVVRRR